MKKNWILVFLILIALVACGGEPETLVPTTIPPAIDKSPLPAERGDYFATSGVCSTCHKNMLDGDGNDVSLDTYWRGTMMANASRDPYWQASVRGEVISHPEYNELIQDKCTTCHTPMARTTQVFMGGVGILLDEGFLNPDNDMNTMALDGISCTLCHQIEADNLGTPESFDGHYVIDATKTTGERSSYGPYETEEAQSIVMKSASGYIPEEATHVQSSELCGSCHTLYTPTVDNDGEVAGLFPEQMPYIEWLASDYADEASCQDCHMPEAPGEVILSVTGGPGRSPFSIHSFAGGNTYALRLLQEYRDELQVTASADQIDAALDRALTQLQEQTAQIAVEGSEINGNILNLNVKVDSQVGHKLPSGFPSRRVWVHLKVADVDGNVVFESGHWDANGGIFGNNNDLDATAFEPHYQMINDAEQVQIYEAIMGDVDAAVTTTLLRGAVYLKDNRLLPAGFDKASVSNDIAVQGNAVQDPDFEGGVDQMVYQIELGNAPGPYTITAELLYQSIGYRWALNLDRFDALEPQRFIGYYENVSNTPTLISGVIVEVGE